MRDSKIYYNKFAEQQNNPYIYRNTFYKLGIVLIVSIILALVTVKYEYWQLFPFTFSALFSSAMLTLIFFFDYIIEGINLLEKAKENAIASAISFFTLAIIVIAGFSIGSSLLSNGFDSSSDDTPNISITNTSNQSREAQVDSTGK